MWYWNKENFEGLQQLAAQMRTTPGCEKFADYCDQRSRGLRKPALKILDEFLQVFDSWNEADRRIWADSLMRLHLNHAEVHQLIAHPLEIKLIFTFESWAKAVTTEASPRRWLGVLTNQPEHFKAALESEPGDEYSLWRLADAHIGDAEYACHHIPDYFIGEISEAEESLRQAGAVIAPIVNTTRGKLATTEISELRDKIQAWRSFKATGTDDFQQWCKDNLGYSWNRPNTIYYQDK